MCIQEIKRLSQFEYPLSFLNESPYFQVEAYTKCCFRAYTESIAVAHVLYSNLLFIEAKEKRYDRSAAFKVKCTLCHLSTSKDQARERNRILTRLC